ncbi:hypothetical protein SB304_22870, partial [Escherichia coli]|nr:hypothetical protein [Escherichia coli]MDW4873155.1 hypothetical protein [Escherichia coli]
SLSHLFCVVVRISPFIRWPNLVCHYSLPVTINGIGTLVLSVCDVNKGKINQHVWQDLGIHINIHRSESIKNVGNPGTIFCAAHICFHV